MRYRLRLETYSDVMKFVGKAENFGKPLLLTDGDRYCVNAKSLLGCLATVEWNNIFIESESESESPQVYSTFEEFIY